MYAYSNKMVLKKKKFFYVIGYFLLAAIILRTSKTRINCSSVKPGFYAS